MLTLIKFILISLIIYAHGRKWKGTYAITNPLYYENARFSMYGGDYIANNIIPKGKNQTYHTFQFNIIVIIIIIKC